MTVKKQTVAAAVEKVAKPKAKVEDFSDVFNVSTEKESSDDREYVNFNGKDRLVRIMPITWNPKYEGKSIKFCIYADKTCPPARFGSLSDLEYLEKKYPVSKQYFISDTICSNGRHRFVVYKMHITDVVDTVE